MLEAWEGGTSKEKTLISGSLLTPKSQECGSGPRPSASLNSLVWRCPWKGQHSSFFRVWSSLCRSSRVSASEMELEPGAWKEASKSFPLSVLFPHQLSCLRTPGVNLFPSDSIYLPGFQDSSQQSESEIPVTQLLSIFFQNQLVFTLSLLFFWLGCASISHITAHVFHVHNLCSTITLNYFFVAKKFPSGILL